MTNPSPNPNETEATLHRLRKIIGLTLADELEALAAAALQARIIASEANIATTEQAQGTDEQLDAAKSQVKELAAPYRDAVRNQRAIQRYCHHQLEAKGKA